MRLEKENENEVEGVKLNVNNNNNIVANKKFESTVNNDYDAKKRERKRIIKNLLVVSFSYLFQFSSINGLHNLQSSLNSHNNLGIFSLRCSSLTFIATCLFIPAILCKLLGFKWSLTCAHLCTLLFVVCNYFPSFFTLLPASFVYGAALSVLWTLQGTFVVHLSNEYASYSKTKHPEKIMFKFFGIFMIIFQMNQIIGNVVSGIVLNENFFVQTYENGVSRRSSGKNLTLESNITLSNRVCGSQSCPDPSSEIVRPDDKKIFWLCFIYVCLTLMAMFTLILMLDDIKPSPEDLGSLSKSLKDTFKMFANVKVWLLIPLIAFNAASNTFITVDFSKSYIACNYGIHTIGYWFVLWGISSSIFSFIVSQLTKLINRTFIILIALSFSMFTMVYVNYWTPNTSIIVMYLLAAVYGFFEGVSGTVLNTIIGTTFLDQQTAAFSNNRFCFSVCYLVAYVYSGYLCVYIKTYIVLSLSAISVVSSIILEVLLRKENKLKAKITNDQTMST